jgi:hypothetical protein
MAIQYSPGSADRYIRRGDQGPADWAGIEQRAALPQSRKYRDVWQYGDRGEIFQAAPNLPSAAIFGGQLGGDTLLGGPLRQSAAESEMAADMLQARGNLLNAEAQAAGQRRAASAQRRGAIGGAALSVGGAVVAGLL